MYRFARQPRWVVLHVLVAIALPAFAMAGLWQLDRLDERRARNARIEERRDQPPLAVAEAAGDPEGAEHRRVELAGAYDVDGQVRLLGRGIEGRSGDHLLTPLVTDGGAVVVDRGWVPSVLDDRTVAASPDGEVTVTGVLLPTEGGPPLGGGTTGAPTAEMSRIDVARIGAQLDDELVLPSHYVQLQTQEPPQADLPEPVPPESLDEGSHLSYAVQWFLFAPTLAVVYVALLRHQARRAAHERV